MFNGETKEDKWDGDPPEETKLEVRCRLKVGTSEKYSNKTLAKVEFNKTLNTTTDSELTHIKKELEQKIEDEFQDLVDLLKNSDRLTEGYHKQERKKKKEESE